MRTSLIALALAATLVVACSSSDHAPTDPVSSGPPSVARIDLTPASASVLVGGSTTLAAILHDSAGNVLTDRAVVWSTGNATVASVSAGVVTGVAAGGPVMISATSEGKSATAAITVATAPPAAVATVSVAPASSALVVGQTVQLAAVTKDAAGAVLSGRVLSWSSSDATHAAVSATGLVTAVAPGSATITASSEGKSGNATVSVTAPASNVLQVGPARGYKTPCAAVAAAKGGETIEIDAATYTGDVCVIAKSLTFRGVGGRPVLDAGSKSAEGKAIWVIRTPNTTVENIAFKNAAVADQNGAGIRFETGNLIVRNSLFEHNENGILTAHDTTATLTVEGTEFANNGYTATGYVHNIYVGRIGRFTMRASYSHGTPEGHLVKSRALENYILYNRITGEDATDSYEIDLPEGGRSFLIGNVIEQGRNSHNSVIVSYAEEGVTSGHTTELFVVNNTIVNDAGSGTFVRANVTTPVVIRNNILLGAGAITNQAGAIVEGNHTTANGDPLFVNRAAYDYRLRSGSPAIDTGIAPGSAFGVSLAPVLQYLHPLQTAARTVIGTAIDRGAYEYAP